MSFLSTILFNPNWFLDFSFYFSIIINLGNSSIVCGLISPVFLITIFLTTITPILTAYVYFTKKPGLTTVAEGATIISGAITLYDFAQKQKAKAARPLPPVNKTGSGSGSGSSSGSSSGSGSNSGSGSGSGSSSGQSSGGKG